MEIRPGSDGLILQPYWGPGLGRPLAKGAIIGFYDVHTKFHLYRAIIEGIGFELKDGLNSIMRRSHNNVKYLTVSGGGSKSDAICQITSDLFNLPVYKSETSENSSLGCAISQFISLGEFSTLEEAKKNMVRYVKVFKPNKKAVEEYEELFKKAETPWDSSVSRELFKKVYVNIYPSLKKSYKNLTNIQDRNNKK